MCACTTLVLRKPTNIVLIWKAESFFADKHFISDSKFVQNAAYRNDAGHRFAEQNTSVTVPIQLWTDDGTIVRDLPCIVQGIINDWL